MTRLIPSICALTVILVVSPTGLQAAEIARFDEGPLAASGLAGNARVEMECIAAYPD